MRADKVFSKITAIRITVLAFLVGFIFIAVAGVVLFEPQSGEYIKTQATVADVVRTENGHRSALVDYEAEGEKFTNVFLGYYASGMKKGDVIEIEYNSPDHSKIRSTNRKTIVIIVGVFGLLAVAVGIMTLIRIIKSR